MIRNVVAYCLVIAFGLIMVIHLGLFWAYGGLFVHEDNTIALLLETLMSITIVAFGIERLVSTTVEGRSHESVAVSHREERGDRSPRSAAATAWGIESKGAVA